MSFYEECVAESTSPWSRCAVGKLLTEYEDAPALEKALDDASVPGTVVMRVLRRRGVNVSSAAIQRHRRRVCSCD